MSLKGTSRPKWLTFDCYGTLIQWDEGLLAATRDILHNRGATAVDPAKFLEVYDRHEHELEQTPPYMSFREVSGHGMRRALEELGIEGGERDAAVLTSRIPAMPPFPEVVGALGRLKAMEFRLCIVSNTDDDIIAGNVAQLGGHIDKVVTAQQAHAYKPDRRLFDHAHELLDVSKDDVVHICASPKLDHAAARDIGFRCVWIDRGTGRKLLPDYTPDAILNTLDQVPQLFATLGW